MLWDAHGISRAWQAVDADCVSEFVSAIGAIPAGEGAKTPDVSAEDFNDLAMKLLA